MKNKMYLLFIAIVVIIVGLIFGIEMFHNKM